MDLNKQFEGLKSSMDMMKKSAIEQARAVSPEMEKEIREILNVVDEGLNTDKDELFKKAMDMAGNFVKNESN